MTSHRTDSVIGSGGGGGRVRQLERTKWNALSAETLAKSPRRGATPRESKSTFFIGVRRLRWRAQESHNHGGDKGRKWTVRIPPTRVSALIWCHVAMAMAVAVATEVRRPWRPHK
ncbi:Protein of unknown function [Gryllus bimaculatus]|nr:Protein of unknown function [Gryllus bimaculatus]